MLALFTTDVHDHSVANTVVALTGVGYFLAWSASFYPQLILNYKRKRQVSQAYLWASG
jgi:hypothetical protein